MPGVDPTSLYDAILGSLYSGDRGDSTALEGNLQGFLIRFSLQAVEASGCLRFVVEKPLRQALVIYCISERCVSGLYLSRVSCFLGSPQPYA